MELVMFGFINGISWLCLNVQNRQTYISVLSLNFPVWKAENAAVGFDVLTTSTQYRLVQSRKTASGGCSAGQGSSEL
jgi:hypothetical protein